MGSSVYRCDLNYHADADADADAEDDAELNVFFQLQLCNEENERLNKMLDNLTKVKEMILR